MMPLQTVFVLWHTFVLPDDQEDVKFIGVYSSHALAQRTRETYMHLPGFCDAPEGFLISEYTLDVNHWRSGFVTVFD